MTEQSIGTSVEVDTPGVRYHVAVLLARPVPSDQDLDGGTVELMGSGDGSVSPVPDCRWSSKPNEPMSQPP